MSTKLSSPGLTRKATNGGSRRATGKSGKPAAAALGCAVLAVSTGLVSVGAQAQEDIVPGSRYTPAAAEAMGGAYLPMASDTASALFYDPSGLAKQKDRQNFTPLNVELYGNSNLFSMMNPVKMNFLSGASLSSFQSTLVSNPGKYASMGGAIAPSFQIKGFGFGLLYQEQVGAIANTDGTFSYRSNYQLIPTAGYGLKLANGIIRLGYSLQWVNQASGAQYNVSPSSATGYNQNIGQGSGFSHTFSYALTLPLQFNPELDLVARNIGGLHFKPTSLYHFSSDPSGTPANEQATYDASFSFVVKGGSTSLTRVVAEMRDLSNTSQVPTMGRAALGMEYSLFDTIILRGGYGTGYPDAGIGLKSKGSELDFTWASEDVGPTYHALRDTRYELQYRLQAF